MNPLPAHIKLGYYRKMNLLHLPEEESQVFYSYDFIYKRCFMYKIFFLYFNAEKKKINFVLVYILTKMINDWTVSV